MADIVNLRLVRKRKARAEREATAEANRILFGRTAAERGQARSEAESAARHLDGHRLGTDGPPPGDNEKDA
ncbi:protein of unknown function [Pseudoxanthobacter soli DSM 19599]|uniref:DUF4169 domain-containing protein n=1 Tax=Pseudoxanthobacter soli DSM 19599 TaxID=1123029 RepID=A0A1M7ZN08_9HYPH|nr:DUF4169 family protein [Pseudoxanthobacter soli]SHO66290.1 protein of unknown function [Pseudoxanthobacter soli DSM 19599]